MLLGIEILNQKEIEENIKSNKKTKFPREKTITPKRKSTEKKII